MTILCLAFVKVTLSDIEQGQHVTAISHTSNLCPLFELMSCMNSYINVLFGSGCSHSFRGTATWFSIFE